jgi:ABC-type enterobactin transport system permease subunit
MEGLLEEIGADRSRVSHVLAIIAIMTIQSQHAGPVAFVSLDETKSAGYADTRGRDPWRPC